MELSYVLYMNGPPWLSFLQGATLGDENRHSRRFLSLRVVRGHVSESRLLSAKFKARYAERRMRLMCDISAVKLEQNVTGGCQEILQTLTLLRPNIAPPPQGIYWNEPAGAKRLNFVYWWRRGFIFERHIRIYYMGIWEVKENHPSFTFTCLGRTNKGYKIKHIKAGRW